MNRRSSPVDSALTHGESYLDAARKGAEMLDFLVWSAQQDGEPLPEPHRFNFDAHRGGRPPDQAKAVAS
jgi:predicted RNase H-like HicB family nuclease